MKLITDVMFQKDTPSEYWKVYVLSETPLISSSEIVKIDEALNTIDFFPQPTSSEIFSSPSDLEEYKHFTTVLPQGNDLGTQKVYC